MNSSLLAGFDALRANPLRTILSTLGVVMGVAAMVSVLALGDGVEQYARAEIERTTDLLSVTVVPNAFSAMDGQYVRRDDIIRLTPDDARSLAGAVPGLERVRFATSAAVMASLGPGSAPRGFLVRAVQEENRPTVPIVAGRWLTDADTAVVVLGEAAARAVSPDSARPADALGRSVWLNGNAHRVVGITAADTLERRLVAFTAVGDVTRSIGVTALPQIALTAARIEDVDSVRVRTERWAAARFGGAWKDRITIANRRDRVEQTATAMRVFKLLMAAITGVSLLVGGVGIMNVLLAAVAERTREIGIRKATGARDRDILTQFLAESVSITGLGAGIGVVIGLAIAFAAAAVMRAETKAPVHAAITPTTVGFAVGVSVLIGVVFGLYPALRAARLSPIDAIRHE